MKKEIVAGGASFTTFSSVPLVADDVNAYEIVYTAPEDLTGTTFEIYSAFGGASCPDERS